jgi:hypothetical protein
MCQEKVWAMLKKRKNREISMLKKHERKKRKMHVKEHEKNNTC